MKSRFAAAFIALTLGVFGVNEFYTGHKTTGFIELLTSVLLSWTGIVPVIISLVNLVKAYQYIWCDTDEEFNNKFVATTAKQILND